MASLALTQDLTDQELDTVVGGVYHGTRDFSSRPAAAPRGQNQGSFNVVTGDNNVIGSTIRNIDITVNL